MTTKTFALNHDLRALPEGGEAGVPQFVQLIPASKTALIQGRDGRAWHNSHPESIVEAFKQRGADLPIDIEHASELKAKQGEPAPAVGWIKALQARDEGAIWGEVEWTEQGQQLIRDKAYRYLSPVFTFDTETQQILSVHSAGLTNQPNLHLTALNHSHLTYGETMNIPEPICSALALSQEATVDAVVAAINQLKQSEQTALNQAKSPSLDAFVPRGDYDLALNRAEKAENNLKAQQQAQLEQQIDDALADALKQGVITPATADYHRACCRQADGLAQFQTFVKKAPKVIPDVALNHSQVNGQALSEDELRVCELLGVNQSLFHEQKEAN